MGRKIEDGGREERFAFGENWKGFLTKFNERRREDARRPLLERFPEGLEGKTFLDIGCGSGLFSLAARDMGAQVVSFDYDEDSVACARYLRDLFYPQDEGWEVFQASVLDDGKMSAIGLYDVVYSWGVLHHTGDLWHAMENAAARVVPGGSLFVSIYNDQGGYSDIWKMVKLIYVRSPKWIQTLVAASTLLLFEGRSLLIQLVRFRNPFKWLKGRHQERGMSLWTDAKDWAGGYPFEVAKPEEVFFFCRDRRFELSWLRTNGGGIACNEFVFVKKADC